MSALLASPLPGALPELSSIEPLEFDEGAQRLIARGDARLEFEDTRLRADRITYYQEYTLADALGNVAISREGFRLIADRLSFDASENVIAVDIPRTGQWPFYISGVTAGGTLDDALVEGAALYYGDPGPFAPSISSRGVRYLEKDDGRRTVNFDGATFRIGSVPIFYLPGYTHNLDKAPYFFNAQGGYDDELGAYLQTTTMVPITDWWRAGLNLDLYSERGVLIGPATQYLYQNEENVIRGALSAGYINDGGDGLEPDLVGQSIDSDRGFVEWRHKHHIGERITLTASASAWSDSEVTRDFRNDYYDNNRNPDNFAEASYAGDNFVASVFGRFRPNDFQLVQERLPEARFDWLPTPIFQTGAYHHASASVVRLEEEFDLNGPMFEEESKSDRYDLNYRVERPIRIFNWLTLTPLAGARLTQYEDMEADPLLTPLTEDSVSREIYEAGFDLVAEAHATYPTVNRTWKIDGLRHIVRPVVRYRYITDPDEDDPIVPIDRDAFDLNRTVLDLGDLRNTDVIMETHLARLGLENLFQTRANDYGSRTLAALNFYQDIIFEEQTRYDGDEEDTFNATWVELELSPAPWLKFDLASRFRTESVTLEELRTRTQIRSGEIWSLGLATDLLNRQIDQYRLDFIYRVNERYSLFYDMRIDADTGDVTKTAVGLRTRMRGVWEVLYGLAFREDARREADVEFTVKVRLVDPKR